MVRVFTPLPWEYGRGEPGEGCSKSYYKSIVGDSIVSPAVAGTGFISNNRTSITCSCRCTYIYIYKYNISNSINSVHTDKVTKNKYET